MENFPLVAKIFKDSDAGLAVANEEDFIRTIHHLLENEDECRRLSRASRETVQKNRGAIQRTIQIQETE